MDRPIVYPQEQVRSFDTIEAPKDILKATGQQVADVLGQTITVAAGLGASQASPASLTVNIGPGSIYQQSALDPTAAGAIPVDGGTYFLQGVSWSTQTVALSTSQLAVGQSQWVLVQATFAFSDIIRAGDPSGGVLPFYNSANPSQPLNGQGNSGATLPTERAATLTLSLVYGAPATTGSQVPPSASANNVGLYLILLTYGQTTITTAQILKAGPSVGTGVPSNYPYAPFLAGLLNAHHSGNPGQAPQIDLTKEVKNVLPLANLPASDSVGVLPTVRSGAGAPTISGQLFDLYLDTGSLVLYQYGGAAWTSVGPYSLTALTGLTNANVTLSAIEASAGVITLVGALTADIDVVFPTLTQSWIVVNNTTGAYTVTCKTSAGTGVTVTQGVASIVYGDGTNIAAPTFSGPVNGSQLVSRTVPAGAMALGSVSGVQKFTGSGSLTTGGGYANLISESIAGAYTMLIFGRVQYSSGTADMAVEAALYDGATLLDSNSTSLASSSSGGFTDSDTVIGFVSDSSGGNHTITLKAQATSGSSITASASLTVLRLFE